MQNNIKLRERAKKSSIHFFLNRGRANDQNPVSALPIIYSIIQPLSSHCQSFGKIHIASNRQKWIEEVLFLVALPWQSRLQAHLAEECYVNFDPAFQSSGYRGTHEIQIVEMDAVLQQEF